MDRSYRDLLRHSGVYGLGHMLGRLASVLLLPVYTRYLSPGDYGVLALLDLAVALLAIVVASGTVRAVTRYHFEAESETERDGLWWTGLLILVGAGVVLLVPAILGRELLATWSLGGEVEGGGLFFLLALLTLALTTVEQLLQAHLRVYKQSELFVVLSLGRLVLNIALNLWLLIGRGMGVVSILWGNLITAAILVALMVAIFVRRRGPITFDSGRIGELLAYGTPLVVASLLAVAMHQLDRYFLRVFLDLGDVGTYSIAYAIGQGINTLILQPFSQIWYVVIYELDGKPQFEEVLLRVFRYFFTLLALVMLGLALFAQPLLWLLVEPAFYGAATLIPPLCLAYLFFSLHSHFNVAPLLAKRTMAVLPAHVAGVVVNVAANLYLIPRMGVMGAALASVVTFAVFSFVGLATYRRIRPFDYPIVSGLVMLAALCGSYLLFTGAASWSERPWATAAMAVGLWIAWALVLGIPLASDWRRHRGFSDVVDRAEAE